MRFPIHKHKWKWKSVRIRWIFGVVISACCSNVPFALKERNRRAFQWRKKHFFIHLRPSRFCFSFSVTRTRGPSVSNCKFRRSSVSFWAMASATSISTRLPSICDRYRKNGEAIGWRVYPLGTNEWRSKWIIPSGISSIILFSISPPTSSEWFRRLKGKKRSSFVVKLHLLSVWIILWHEVFHLNCPWWTHSLNPRALAKKENDLPDDSWGTFISTFDRCIAFHAKVFAIIKTTSGTISQFLFTWLERRSSSRLWVFSVLRTISLMTKPVRRFDSALIVFKVAFSATSSARTWSNRKTLAVRREKNDPHFFDILDQRCLSCPHWPFQEFWHWCSLSGHSASLSKLPLWFLWCCWY